MHTCTDELYVDKLIGGWTTCIDKFFDKATSDNDLPIMASSECMSKSLSNRTHFTRSNACEGCRAINSLNYDFFLNKDKEVKIACGKYKGETLRMYSHLNIDTKLIRNNNTASTENPFVNYIVISSILHKITNVTKYPYTTPYMWSFICNNTFNIILNMKYMKTLRELSKNPILSKQSPLAAQYSINVLDKKIVKDIYIQMTLMLFFLSKFEFTHGEPSIRYITFSPTNCNFIFKNVHVKSKVGLIICPSTKSAITYNNIRYFYGTNKSPNSDEIYENRKVLLDNRSYNGDYKKHRVIYNKIGNRYENLIELYTRHGKYIKSFDFVVFFTSLIADKSFYDAFKDDEKLSYIWKSLWEKSDYLKVMIDMKRLKCNDFSSITNLVKKYYFRDDALEFGLNSLYDL